MMMGKALTGFTAGSQGQRVDDGHEDASGPGCRGGHGGCQKGFRNAEAIGKAQSALPTRCHKQIRHSLTQACLLKTL